MNNDKNLDNYEAIREEILKNEKILNEKEYESMHDITWFRDNERLKSLIDALLDKDIQIKVLQDYKIYMEEKLKQLQAKYARDVK